MAISISRVSTLPTQLSGYLPGSRVVLPNGKEYILNNSKLWIPIHMMALEIKDNLTTQSLNDVTIPGIYHNRSSSYATVLKNYPAEGLQAGVLIVYTDNDQIFQSYTILAGQINEDKTFTRGKYAGSWSGWKVPNYINITQAEWNSVNTNNHTHANKALLDTYTQTNANIASAVTNSHTHANKLLLDTYNQTNVNLTSAVTNNHTHANKALLDTYTQTNANIISAITNNHTHTNKALLDTYNQTNVNLTNAVTNSHTHSNKTQLDNITAQKILNWDAAHTWGNHASQGYLTLTVADTKYIKTVGLGQELDGDIRIIDTVNENRSFFASGVSYASIKFDTLSLSGFGLTTKLINSSSMKYHLGISTYSFITSTTTTLSFIEYDDNLMKWTIGQDNFVYFNPLKLGTAGGIRTLTIDAAGKLGYVEGLPISSFTENDPTVPAHVKAITTTQVNNWNFLVSNYFNYVDNRSIKPNSIPLKTLQFGFASFANNNSGPVWADFLHFGGYQDASGGNQNLILFSKLGFNIRQYQGEFQGNTAYTNFVDYWHSGDFTSANITAWNLAVTNNHTHSNKAILDNINQNLGTTHSPTFVDLISKTFTLNNTTKLTDITAYGTGYHQMVQFSNVSGSQKLWTGAVADSVGSYIMNNAYYNSSNSYIPNYTSASGVHFKNNGEIHFIADTGLTSGTAYTPTAKMWINTAGVVGISNSLTVTNQITSAGLNKTGSSNLYVLLGASGHKLISDFWLKTDFTAAILANWNTAYTYSQVGHIPLTQKGANNGVATLDASGKIPASQLPAAQASSVIFANLASQFPTIGNDDTLYVLRITGQIYKWYAGQYTEVTANILKVSYAQLFDLRDSGSLKPGMKYRITDFATFTDPNAYSFISDKNRFDIIVTAIDESTLNENASAARCETLGINYFPAYTNFNAWELKYTIFNDNTKYDWADVTDGKGVIYYMKDDNGNECPYDFKSIRFRRNAISAVPATNQAFMLNTNIEEHSSQYKQRIAWSTELQQPYFGCTVNAIDNAFYYTFTQLRGAANTYGTIHDQSTFNTNDDQNFVLSADFLYNLNQYVFSSNNIIKPYLKKVVINDKEKQIQYLNNIIMTGARMNDIASTPNPPIMNNIFHSNCKNMTFFGGTAIGNEIGVSSTNNVFGSRAMFNKAEDNFQNNAIGHESDYNTFGDSFQNNAIYGGAEANVFGKNCKDNSIGIGMYNNIILNSFNSNMIGDGFTSNTIDTNFNGNTIGNGFVDNKVNINFNNNNVNFENNGNTYGISIMGCIFGYSNSFNDFGSNIRNINFGNNKGNSEPNLIVESNIYRVSNIMNIDSKISQFVHTPKRVRIMQGSTNRSLILEHRVNANLTEAIDVI